MSALVDSAAGLGITLTTAHLAQLDQFGAMLREGNRRVNLTRVTDPGAVETRHFLDSLSAAVPFLDRLAAGEALRRLHDAAGTQFDPRVVEVCARVLASRGAGANPSALPDPR